MSLQLDHISPSLLSDLDADFPNWRESVPEDKAPELNEETLIQLLKNSRRATFYRAVVDKRNSLFKEMFDNSNRSTQDLVKEFATFNAEEGAKWWAGEEKLNAIIQRFRGRGKTENTSEVRTAFTTISQKLNEAFEVQAKELEEATKTIMNNTVNTISSGHDETTKTLNELFESQMPKLHQDNQSAINDYKEFVVGTVGGLLQDKISKMEKGELPLDAFNRSDFLTDEEEQELQNKAIQTLETIMERRSRLNASAMEEVIIKQTGLSGTKQFLEKLNGLTDDLLIPEVKAMLREAISSDVSETFTGRDKRKIKLSSYAIAFAKWAKPSADKIQVASLSAAVLHAEAKIQKLMPKQPKRSNFYNWCNKDTSGLGHVLTWGYCTGYTIGEIIKDIKAGRPIDLEGLANVVSFASLLFGVTGLLYGDFFKKAAGKLGFAIFSPICEMVADKVGLGQVSFVCSGWNGIAGKALHMAHEITMQGA